MQGREQVSRLRGMECTESMLAILKLTRGGGAVGAIGEVYVNWT